MSDAAIRKALEVAWRASTVDPDDAPEGVAEYQRAKAAVTIAAFLRALPKGAEIPRNGIPGWMWEPWIGEDIAAAVERAAGGGA